jgi:hypothetical protein
MNTIDHHYHHHHDTTIYLIATTTITIITIITTMLINHEARFNGSQSKVIDGKLWRPPFLMEITNTLTAVVDFKQTNTDAITRHL